MSPALFSTGAATMLLAWGFLLPPAGRAAADDDAAPVKAVKTPAPPPLATMRHDTVASLIAQLDSPVPAARALVACAMAERKADAAAAVPSLVALLDDDAQVSPYICREEWWRNGDRESGRWWRDDAEPTTPGQEAARALAAIGSPSFTPVLGVLANGGAHGRRNAAWILGALRDERAVLPLVAQTTDRVAGVRENVAWSLGAIRDQRAVEALARVVEKDASPDVREKAAWALGAIRDARAVDALTRALRDADHDVRRQAAWALGAIRDPKALDGLMAALKDPQSEVRRQAAWALGAIGDGRATEVLTTALDDADPDVRKQAAWALGAVVRHR